MNKNLFSLQIKKLNSIYGEKSFSEAKIDAVWSIVENLSDSWFEKIVDKLIQTCTYSPMPAHFFEEAQIEKAKRFDVPEYLNKPFPNEPMSEKTISLLSDWKKKMAKKIDDNAGES